MLQIRMSASDLGRTRFAYSPLAEIGTSLFMLATGRVHPPFRRWAEEIRPRLARVDMDLLRAVVPDRPLVVDLLFVGVEDANTDIDRQLAIVAALPAELIAEDLGVVWRGDRLPPAGRELIALGPAAPRAIADELHAFWTIAIEPYWRAMRAVLDDDVAHRAGELTRGGVHTMLGTLHPEVSVRDEMLHIDKKRYAHLQHEHDLEGDGMLLVPSIFVWPRMVFLTGSAPPFSAPPSLTYAARGVGNVFGAGATDADPNSEDAALGALIGQSRAQILASLARPRTTTELALLFKQSPSSVSQHLSILRDSGMVTSWRSGRRVLYRRTDLGSSIIAVNRDPGSATA